MNAFKTLINRDCEYITVTPESSSEKGHGNGISVKIVVPGFCQAKCPFCFNHCTTETQTHDTEIFFTNLTESLDLIFDNVDRKISLDITGNEPTFSVRIFRELMLHLKRFKNKTEKIVLTTNGFHLKQCLPYMYGIVDIVNISLHHYDEEIRKNEILQTKFVPSNEELKDLIAWGNSIGIKFTAVAVLYKKFENFNEFYTKFVDFAKSNGFNSVRFRCNCIEYNDYTDEVMSTKHENQVFEDLPSLKTIKINDNGFDVRIYKGIPDLTTMILGVELVIDDDGALYVDYNKRYQVTQEKIHLYNKIYLMK